MTRRAFIIAGCRTAVAPRGGAFLRVEAYDLAAPVLRACLEDAGLDAGRVDHVILGNALSGGGNIARLAALKAGLPERVPALTVDTQCCSGLDAVILAMRLVESGAAEAVLAGGVESWSRSPLRARRPRAKGEEPVFYERPPFAPWPERDPELLDAMAALALSEGIGRFAQAEISAASHARALAARGRLAREIVPLAGLGYDSFTRPLSTGLSMRSPVVAGEGLHAIDATGVAVQADAAAVVLVASQAVRDQLGLDGCAGVGAASAGGAPERPFAALVPAVKRACGSHGAPAVVELMESTAVQFISNRRALGLDPARINRGGGALARGHPVGASGAILAVRLFHELLGEPDGARGLAAIAAAGGLGSALLLQRS